MQEFRNKNAWIFDLDNTLYPTDYALFSQIDKRMTAFIQEELKVDRAQAFKIQKDYLGEYGTTLSGLMNEHNMPPERFLDFVHDIDVSVLTPNPSLAAAIDALPGRKFIFTNGTVDHAARVSNQLGVQHLFDDVFDIVAANYIPKPHIDVYPEMVKAFNVQADQSVFFEDMARNLAPAHKLGMGTVLVHSKDDDGMGNITMNGRDAIENPHFIDHRTTDLTGFLQTILDHLETPVSEPIGGG